SDGELETVAVEQIQAPHLGVAGSAVGDHRVTSREGDSLAVRRRDFEFRLEHPETGWELPPRDGRTEERLFYDTASVELEAVHSDLDVANEGRSLGLSCWNRGDVDIRCLRKIGPIVVSLCPALFVGLTPRFVLPPPRREAKRAGACRHL